MNSIEFLKEVRISGLVIVQHHLVANVALDRRMTAAMQHSEKRGNICYMDPIPHWH